MAKKKRGGSPDVPVGDDPFRELEARAKKNPMLYAKAIGLTEEIKYSRASRKVQERRALNFWTPLMDQLEARTGRKIKNRREFCKEISFSAWAYKYEKACDEGMTAKQVRIGYEEMLKHFHAFRLACESALHTVPAPPSVPLMLALYRDDRYDVEDPIEMMKRIREDLDRFDRLLHKALDYARSSADLDLRGGNRSLCAMDITIPALGKQYKRAIDRDWGVSVEVEDGGPFVAFVRGFLELVEPDAKRRKALAETIKNIRQEHTKRTQL